MRRKIRRGCFCWWCRGWICGNQCTGNSKRHTDAREHRSTRLTDLRTHVLSIVRSTFFLFVLQHTLHNPMYSHGILLQKSSITTAESWPAIVHPRPKKPLADTIACRHFFQESLVRRSLISRDHQFCHVHLLSCVRSDRPGSIVPRRPSLPHASTESIANLSKILLNLRSLARYEPHRYIFQISCSHFQNRPKARVWDARGCFDCQRRSSRGGQLRLLASTKKT